MTLKATPSFSSPPLDEVVLGVQFTPPDGFNTTFNGDIYQLFRKDFPFLEEQPPLAPQIEAFGGNPQSELHINFGEPLAKPRLWFSSSDNSHLLQHQEDRLLLNWRNRSSSTPYPRHEKMSKLFAQHLHTLERFYKDALAQPISITQAEVGYINIIPVNSLSEIDKWLTLINGSGSDFEGLAATFGTVVYSQSSQPIARMIYEVQAVFHQHTRQPAIRFALTCRGKPSSDTLEAGLDFITFARSRVVSDFCKHTTSKAHEAWGRL